MDVAHADTIDAGELQPILGFARDLELTENEEMPRRFPECAFEVRVFVEAKVLERGGARETCWRSLRERRRTCSDAWIGGDPGDGGRETVRHG